MVMRVFFFFLFFFWFCGWVCDSRFCLFVFRQNISCVVETSLSWLNLPNAGITGVCHFTPCHFYIWRGVSRDLIWCIWDCLLSQHYLLKAVLPPRGSGTLGLCLWLCQWTLLCKTCSKIWSRELWVFLLCLSHSGTLAFSLEFRVAVQHL